ncbi:MAG: hypothetical protein ABFS21_11685 [Actinomycetota bacterium]
MTGRERTGTSIGRIVRLQVHAESLKRDGAFDPGPLVSVERASIGSPGMLGWNGTGWILDNHHSAHPQARGGGHRVLSVGFTGHYERIRARFGDVPTGAAGENIVIDGPAVTAGDISGGLLIRTGDGAVLELRSPQAAVACTGFTSFLLGSPVVLPREEITEHLAFLSTGTRGFIVSVDHVDRPVEIAVGDEIFTR